MIFNIPFQKSNFNFILSKSSIYYTPPFPTSHILYLFSQVKIHACHHHFSTVTRIPILPLSLSPPSLVTSIIHLLSIQFFSLPFSNHLHCRSPLFVASLSPPWTWQLHHRGKRDYKDLIQQLERFEIQILHKFHHAMHWIKVPMMQSIRVSSCAICAKKRCVVASLVVRLCFCDLGCGGWRWRWRWRRWWWYDGDGSDVWVMQCW